MKRISLFFLIVAIACCFSWPAAAESIDKHFQKNFKVDKDSRLHLNFDDGNVSVIPWEKSELDVEIIYVCDYSGFGAGKDPEFNVDFKQRGKTVDIVVEQSGGWGIGVFNQRLKRFEIVVQAPEWLILDLVGEDGDVEISDWHNDIDIRLDDGSVNLDNCKFEKCNVETEDGDIWIRECSGDFQLETDDGSIRLQKIIAGKIGVEIEDGDLDIVIAKSTDLDIYIMGEDGEIDVTLDSGASAKFELRTDDGDIDVDGDVDMKRNSENRKSGKIGSGEGSIRIACQDGDISLTVRR